LRQSDILAALASDEKLLKQGGGVPELVQGEPVYVMRSQRTAYGQLTFFRNGDTAPVFHPEFGRFMIEATPGKPWGIGFKDLLDVEPNMKLRCYTF